MANQYSWWTKLVLTAALLVGCSKEGESMEWPNTTPSDRHISYSDGHTQYKKAEVKPGQWQWVVDEEAMKSMREEADHKRKLYQALRTQLLTDTELQEALDYGDYLNTENMVPYDPTEKAKQLNDAFVTQHRFALQARKAKP